jgi:hypothetical protein
MNSQRHENNLTARHPGSCEWLSTHPAFQNWLNTTEIGCGQRLWLKGSPGLGKSLLCSTAIEHVTQLQEICLYYFYRFDAQVSFGQDDDESRDRNMRAASVLVGQLFRHFWQQNQQIEGPVGAYIKTTEKNFAGLAGLIHLLIKHGNQHPQDSNLTNAPNLIKVYLFLDGLDEIKNRSTAKDVLTMFEGLENEFPAMVKVCISSRDTNVLSHRLGQSPAINVDKHTESDVNGFLENSIPDLCQSIESEQEISGMRRKDRVHLFETYPTNF